MPGWSAARLGLCGDGLDRQGEGALLVGAERAYAYQLAANFLAAIIAHRDDNGVLPRLTFGRMTNAAFDA